MKKMKMSQVLDPPATQGHRSRTTVHPDTYDSLMNSDDTEQSESPESIYTETSATPYSQFSEDDRGLKSSDAPSTDKTRNRNLPPFGEHPHITNPTAPIMPTRIRSAPAQKLRNIHDRQVIASVRHTQFLGTESDISPVRRKIALLEEKTMQEAIGFRPPFTSRYTTN